MSIRVGSQSVAESVDSSYLPNLPGYRSKPRHSSVKPSHFELKNGIAICKDSSHDYPKDDNASTLQLYSTKKKTPTQDFGVILTYMAYFEEFPEGLREGDRQIRFVKIHYFLEDDTIQIVEKPQVNSGTTQGTLLRRNVVLKEDGESFYFLDLVIGQVVEIQKRFYMIYDCDEATKQYLIDIGNDPQDVQPYPVPEDSYQRYRKTLQADLDVTGDWARFHSKKNDTKTFADAMMGVLVDNSGREGFMKFGQTTLNFKCVWDNTPILYGDKLEFALKYHLCDDTIEILSAGTEGTSDSKKKLVKRAPLPKDFVNTMVLGNRPAKKEFYNWSDFYIGLHLPVYSRQLQLVDADYSTRQFYFDKGVPLGEAIIEEQLEIVAPQREIPPPTGFGSEEDSMRSVSGSLMPGPVPVKKLGENKIVSFFASLLSGGIDDVDRRFVISYYVQDNTLKIAEPPVRNSGFTGGMFLSRREIKKANGDLLKVNDLYIGQSVQILKHRFKLLDASASTLKWMEQSIDIPFPRSNYYTILDKIRPALMKHAESGTLHDLFSSEETNESGNGQATVDTLRQILDKYHLTGDDHPDDVSEHELRTILRGAGNEKSTFDYRKFIEQILAPTDEFK